MKKFAVIPSGGKGTRLKSLLPKQYIKVHGKEIIAYTLDVFQNSENIDEICIAAEPEYFELIEEIKKKYAYTKLKYIVPGGKTRQESVYKGIMSLPASDNDIIAVHDAARPLLPLEILNNSINKAIEVDNVVVAIKARDTLIKGNQFVSDYVNRDLIYYAQTPQVFKSKNLKDAMEKAIADNFLGTDESMLVKRAGYKVQIVDGSSMNFKVTAPSDLETFTLISK